MDKLIRQCAKCIRKAAIIGNGAASVWYMYQPKKPVFNRETGDRQIKKKCKSKGEFMMKHKLTLTILVISITMLLFSSSLSAWTGYNSNTKSIYSMWFESGVPFSVNLRSEMRLYYSDYSNPYPGYRLIEKNELIGRAVDAGMLPFNLIAIPDYIKRYDNGRLALSITNFYPPSGPYYVPADWLNDAYFFAYSNTESYLVKEMNNKYQFDGRSKFFSDTAVPYAYYCTASYTYNY